MSNRNYKNELLIQSKKDKSTRLMINKQFIENTGKINRDVKCIFICKCGLMSKKALRQILGDTNKNNGSGLFCSRCTEINRNLKMKKQNGIDNKLLKSCITWWLVKIGKNYTNRKKWSKEDILNICRIEYERNGMSALIPKNLDSLPGIGLYNTYIRKYKKDENYQEEFKLSVRGNQNQKTPGYPDIYICEHLDLVNERKKYLKNTFPCETETFEEMCEIHIRPFLDNYLKDVTVNGFILTEHIFYSNNKCDIKGGLKKHKKGINELRQYFQLNTQNLESLRKDREGYYERRNSKAEIVFDNFLVLYTYLTNDHVKWEEPYPQDFVEKYKKKCKSDCTITINNIKIIVEIWNYSPDNIKNIGNQKNRCEDYLKLRKIKEDYWKTRDDIIFIGIENEKLYCNQCEFNAVTECKKILSPYIKIRDNPKKTGHLIFPKNDYNLMIDECKKYFIKNNNKLYDDLPKKIIKIIKRTYGNMTKGLCELRKILHTEINWEELYAGYKSPEELQKIKEKTKQTNNNKSPEEKKLIRKNMSNARNNKSSEEKEKWHQKISESRKQFSKEKWEKIHKKTQEKLINDNGGVHPMIGKKLPRHTKEEYKSMYAPLICKFLQSLNEGDKINASSDKWINFSKNNPIPKTPWNNKPDYNPWYETKWEGFIETGIEYANENDIKLPTFYYKKVVSSDKRNKKKNYNEEDVWNIHVNFVKYCNENNIEKTKKNANKYFRDNNFIMTLDTLISKNNKNSEIFGTTYPEFLKRTGSLVYPPYNLINYKHS